MSEQIRELSSSLQNVDLQGRRMSRFGFEPYSLPASRVRTESPDFSSYVHVLPASCFTTRGLVPAVPPRWTLPCFDFPQRARSFERILAWDRHRHHRCMRWTALVSNLLWAKSCSTNANYYSRSTLVRITLPVPRACLLLSEDHRIWALHATIRRRLL